MRTLLSILAGLTLASTAAAVPMTLTHSGRLLDTAGVPINGTHNITVGLYDDGGVNVWEDTFTNVSMQQGYYAVVLGSGTPLAATDLTADALTARVQIDSNPAFVSQTPLSSVPFAVRAEETRNLVGGSVDATTIAGDSMVLTGDMQSDSVTANTVTVSDLVVAGQSLGGPIIGEWYPSSTHDSSSNSYEFMSLNSQQFNTDTSQDYFTWNGADTIVFNTDGYYRVDLRSMSYSNGEGNHFELWKSGERMHLSHSMHAGSSNSWRRHATSVVSSFSAGDTLKVRVYCRSTSTPHCYHGGGGKYTALTVQLVR